MIIKMYLAAAILAGGLSAQASAAEAVVNGGFDGVLSPEWSFSRVSNRVASTISNTGVVDTILPGSSTLSQSIYLTAGNYNFDFTGFFLGSTTVLKYSIDSLVSGKLTGSEIAGSKSYGFSVATEGFYDLTFKALAGGSLAAFAAVDNVSVSSVTAVPGPEAGAGLGALALGGVAMWAKRRQQAKALTS
ncbi:hypothetical protein [Neorhizobium sp. NCHU2750]|uniref:hypothetical protein n=1 Tax=Neorhizobium sp. NCHU2750 TaxID=1825976 RepID=UPI000EB63EE8|nr:hypothetical protein NCHU2750_11640 [Neorhizobium sp. NCHU2750]